MKIVEKNIFEKILDEKLINEINEGRGDCLDCVSEFLQRIAQYPFTSIQISISLIFLTNRLPILQSEKSHFCPEAQKVGLSEIIYLR